MFWRRYKGEFRKTWFGAESREGFRIEIRSKNWIDHIQERTRRRVFAEPMGRRNGWIVYASPKNCKGFEKLTRERTSQIFDDIRRALEFLGYEVDMVE